MTTILTTDRLTLRTFETTDAPLVAEYVGNWNVCSMLSRVPYPYTRAMADQWIAGHAASPDITCAIEFENTLVGCIGQEQEFGYWLAEPFWGKGIMTEAARAFVSFLFEEKGMHDLVSGYKKDNTASAAVLRKCGFEIVGEGTLFCLAQDRQIERWEVTTNRHIWEKVREDW